MKKTNFFISIFFLLTISFGFSVAALAQESVFDRMDGAIGSFNLPGSDERENADALAQSIIGRIISAVLGIFGIVFMILIIYAGYNWMMARGNEEKVTKAKNTLQGAVIGLIITMASYAIALFVANAIQGAVNVG